MENSFPRLWLALSPALCLRLTLIVLSLVLAQTWSSRARARQQCQPPPSVALNVTPGKASFFLSWGSAGANASYQLFRAIDQPSGFTEIPESSPDGNPLTQTDGNNIQNNRTYFYYVLASNGCGQTASNTVQSETVLGPASVSASPGPALVSVSWGTAANADSYSLYKSTDGQNFGTSIYSTSGSGPLSYTDHQVFNGVTYYYKVLTGNNGGGQVDSNVASATVNLGPPLGVRAVRVSTNEIDISWNTAPDAENYSIRRSDSPTGSFQFAPDFDNNSSNTAAIDSNVSATSVYYYFVVAGNTAGNSPPSAIVSSADGNNQPDAGYCCSDPSLSAGSGSENGGSAHDPVNLATGAESYTPKPDITVYNQNGPGVAWQRNYHSYQALRGYASPGLSAGWSHSYDFTLQSIPGTWGTLNLVYANGAAEPLMPEIGAGGQPTGVLLTRAGTPYFARGVPGANTGEWASVTLTWKDQTEWRFTPYSAELYALGRVTNRVGKGIDLMWGGNRTLSQVTDTTSGAALLTLSYGADGRLASVADVYGRQVVYTYTTPFGTAPGNLASVSQVGAAGTTLPARWTYTYDSTNGQQLHTISVPNPIGSGLSTATINYDGRGKVTSLIDANGNQRVITYGAGSSQVQVKDAAGTTVTAWTQNYSTSRRDTGIIDANNKSTLREYNDSANPLKPTSIVDRNGKATSFTYDQFGNVLTVTTPRGITTVYTYDYTNFALGRLTKVKEGSKPETTFAYFEPSGLLQSVTSPSPTGTGTVTISHTYDALGNVLTVTGPGNNAASQITTTFGYTTDNSYTQPAKVGQPLTVTDNLGHVTHLRYDAQGRITSRTDALGHETSASYNLIGQVEQVTYPATGQTGTGHARAVNSYLYTGGPLTAATLYDESNVQARQVAYGYGAEGEAGSVTGSTEPVTYTYDALYRVKTLKDGKDNTTTYNYDSVGNVSSVQMPGGENVSFPLHDPSGRVLRRIDGNGVTTNYSYDDPENLLTDIQYPSASALNVHFGYDAFGRRASMTDSTGSHAYVYGDLDELQSVTTAYTGAYPMTVSYSYNPDGSRSEMETPAGAFLYSYDEVGRMTSLVNPFDEETNWGYFDNGWLASQRLSNTALTDYTYDARGQLTRLKSLGALGRFGQQQTLSDYVLTYDGGGNRASTAATIPAASSLEGLTSYQYDVKDQLTQEQSQRAGSYTNTFSYDAAGNPTTFKGTAQTFNANSQRTSTGFAHDANGNPTTYKGATLSFDPENRLTSYGTAMTAGYRGDGLRAWKESNGTRTYFLYDGSLPIFETDLSDNGERVNTFGAAGLVSRHEQSCLDCDGSAFYTFDPQGNVSQSLNERAAPTSSEAYDAHGAAIVGSGGPWGYGAQWGYYTDEETGLQLLTHRYYDPQAGRFLTRDPIGYLGGVNLYEHVRNNPVGFDDPSGLDGISHARPRIMPPDPGDVGPKYIGDPPSKQGTIDPPPIRPTPPTPPTVSGPPSGGGGCGCETAVPRWPDFYTFGGSVPLPDLPFIGGSLHVTIDRNWNMYVSPGVAVGYPSAGGGSATAGWLNQWCKPTSSQLEGLLTGPAIGVSGASPWGLAGGFSWSPGNGSATQIGLGGPIGGGVSGGWGFRFR